MASGKSILANCLGPNGPSIPLAEFFDDFVVGGTTGKFSSTADVGQWLLTTDNSGTVTIADAAPDGVARSTPGTSANDFNSIQMNGEAWTVNASRDIYFATRIRTNDADDIKFYIGLGSTDVTGTTAGPLLDGTNNSICFRNTAGNTTSFTCVTEDDTTETVTSAVGDLADSVWKELAFVVRGTSRVEFYVDNVLVATHTTNLPDAGDGLTLSFEVGSPTGTTATYLDIDYVYICATGSRA